MRLGGFGLGQHRWKRRVLCRLGELRPASLNGTRGGEGSGAQPTVYVYGIPISSEPAVNGESVSM